MNRRDSLKTLIIGTAGAGLATALPGCRTRRYNRQPRSE